MERGIEFAWRANPKCRNQNSFAYKLCVELHAGHTEKSYNKIKNFFDQYGLHDILVDIRENNLHLPTAEELDETRMNRVLGRNLQRQLIQQEIGVDAPLSDMPFIESDRFA